MGIDIYAKDQELNEHHELHWREPAWLVVRWCGKFETRKFDDYELRDRDGLVDFPQNIVKATNAAVPRDYDAAKLANLVWGEPRLYFRMARNFLAAAAKFTSGISGSY